MIGQSVKLTTIRGIAVGAPETPILEVLQTMEGEDVNQVPVEKSGQLVGMLTRDHILRVLSTKMELGRIIQRPRP